MNRFYRYVVTPLIDSALLVFGFFTEKVTERIVWIVGSSIIYWAEQRTFDREISNLDLDYLGIKIYWKGIRGMKWESLITILESMSHLPEPDVLVIHLGSNDIMSIESRVLIQLMKHDLQIIRGMFPETVIVFSEILARLKWRGNESPEEGEQRRTLVNKKICKHLIKRGGFVISHPGVSVEMLDLFRIDGVHMNNKGNDVLIDEFGIALENYFCEKYPELIEQTYSEETELQ